MQSEEQRKLGWKRMKIKRNPMNRFKGTVDNIELFSVHVIASQEKKCVKLE